MLSKMRKASSARNRTATMIAARMFGMITFHSRCHQVAPSTSAASSMSSDTWESPASRSSDMNGVVFQISETMMANIAGPWLSKQLRSRGIPGAPQPVGLGTEPRQPAEPAVDPAVVEAERELPRVRRDHRDDPVGDQDRG